MKCLSIRQPWAWLIVNAHKDVENRSWRTDYRGPLLIHAAKQWDSAGDGAIQRIWTPDLSRKTQLGFASCLLHLEPRGAIIGQVNLVDCVRDSDSAWAEAGMWHWLLEDVQAVPEPIAYRGRQGLFEVPWPIEEARINDDTNTE